MKKLKLFSHNKNFGIAYIKTDFDEIKNKEIICGDSNLKISSPWWSKT